MPARHGEEAIQGVGMTDAFPKLMINGDTFQREVKAAPS